MLNNEQTGSLNATRSCCYGSQRRPLPPKSVRGYTMLWEGQSRDAFQAIRLEETSPRCNKMWNMAVNNISYPIYPLSTRTEKGYITKMIPFFFCSVYMHIWDHCTYTWLNTPLLFFLIDKKYFNHISLKWEVGNFSHFKIPFFFYVFRDGMDWHVRVTSPAAPYS